MSNCPCIGISNVACHPGHVCIAAFSLINKSYAETILKMLQMDQPTNALISYSFGCWEGLICCSEAVISAPGKLGYEQAACECEMINIMKNRSIQEFANIAKDIDESKVDKSASKAAAESTSSGAKTSSSAGVVSSGDEAKPRMADAVMNGRVHDARDSAADVREAGVGSGSGSGGGSAKEAKGNAVLEETKNQKEDALFKVGFSSIDNDNVKQNFPRRKSEKKRTISKLIL